ncbi:MAG: hypothetical protein LUF92_14880 [Clostridiales bacterium]|nr:hypothetical protein [Clostridiales bacterium]
MPNDSIETGETGYISEDSGNKSQKKRLGKNRIKIGAAVCAVAVLLIGVGAFWLMYPRNDEDDDVTTAENYQEVNDTITTVVSSDEYSNMDTDEKAELILSTLSSLVSEGEVASDSVGYDETNKLIYYEYADGAYGGVMLEDFAEGTSGVGTDSYNTAFIYDENEETGYFENWPSVPSFELDSSPYEQEEISALIVCDFGEEDEGWLIYAQEEQNSWSEAYMNTTLTDEGTVAYYRDGLSGYDLVIIQEHGMIYNSTPIIVLQETISWANYHDDAVILKDLYKNRIAMINLESDGRYHYCLLPDFFTYYYEDNQLADTIVWLGCCDGYYNDSLVSAFADCGAKAVLATTETTSTAYNFLMQDAFVYMLLCGNTVDESLAFAKSTWGSNDQEFKTAYGIGKDSDPSEIRYYNGGDETLVTLTEEAIAEAQGNETDAVTDSADHIDYENLVTSAYSATYNSMSFEIPQININSEYVASVNQEIWDALFTELDELISYWEANNDYDGGEYISYKWYVNGDILSLVIESHLVDWAWWDYCVYNIEISTGSAVSESGLLSYYGISEDDYKKEVRQALYSYNYDGLEQSYNNYKKSQDQERMDYINTQLALTISEENVALSQPFLNENGQLCIIGRVYSPVEADYYEHIINLEEYTVNPNYPSLFETLNEDTQESESTQDVTNNVPDDGMSEDQVWLEFLTSGNYLDYTDDWETSYFGAPTGWEEMSPEYVIVDLNADGVKELLIQATYDSPFYTTWTFALDGSDIVFVGGVYGYGSYRYSSSLNAVLVSPELKPFSGTGYYPFYQLQDVEYIYSFSICQDEGTWYFADADGNRRIISDNERESYFADVEYFGWKDLNVL